MKKILLIILSLILICVGVFSGCSCSNSEENGENTVNINEDTEGKFNVTEYDLVNNGKTDYKIVIPQRATDYEKLASSELQLFIKKATNCDLTIVYDNQALDSDYYISIGNTAMLSNEASIVIDSEKLKDAGLLIKTIDKAVYLVGATGTGTVNAVYAFLEYHIGFKAYAQDCVVYKNFVSLKLLNIDYSYTPSVQFLVSNEQENNFSEDKIVNNMRMHITTNIKGSGGYNLNGKLYTLFVHTNDYVISYTEENKRWFNEQRNQLCYSNDEMIEEFSKRLYNNFVMGRSEPFIMLGANDFETSCNCDNCKAAIEKYGSQGGIYVRFMNKVADYIERRFEENGIERKLTLVGLMYYAYNKAPVIEQADGTYKPICDEVIPDSEGQVTVGCCYTPINACFTHPFNDTSCQLNNEYYEGFKKWSSLTKELSAYIYSTNSASYMMPFNNWATYGENFKLFDELGVRHVYDEACSANGLTSMQSMRIFIRSSLAWNANLNTEDLIREFIGAYYGVGSPYVMEYFNSMMEQYEFIYQKTKNEHHAYNYAGHDSADCWPLSTLLNFENLLQSGMNAINANEYLSNEEKNIYTERIFREYCLNKIQQHRLFRNVFPEEEGKELDEFVEYAKTRYGIVKAANS